MKLKNTYAFDHVFIDYLQCLFFCCVVRTTASQEKRAQDKTTVRKSEFTFRSDGLSLSQTVQPDNALAAVTTTSNRKALNRVGSEDCPADQTFRQCAGYHDFDVADQTLERVYLPPTPAGDVNHLFAHRYESALINNFATDRAERSDITNHTPWIQVLSLMLYSDAFNTSSYNANVLRYDDAIGFYPVG